MVILKDNLLMCSSLSMFKCEQVMHEKIQSISLVVLFVLFIFPLKYFSIFVLCFHPSYFIYSFFSLFFWSGSFRYHGETPSAALLNRHTV